MRRFLPILLLVTACRSVNAPDVAAAFADEFTRVRLRIPKKGDLDPARAASASMAGTIGLAREYLDGDPGTSMHARYVRSLLACAHLMRGETAEARDVMRNIRPNRDFVLVHEHRVINAVVHAVSVSRSLQARRALGSLFEERLTTTEFVRRYGSFVSISLPDPVAPAYADMLNAAATRLRADCFMEVAGDPYELEAMHKERSSKRRTIGEQIYNDAVALMVALPPGESAEAEWLAHVGVSAFIAYGRIFHEVVPMSLGTAQKEWQLEQVDGLFQRTKKTAARLRTRPIYERLEKHIFNAEVEIRGWIETR